MSFGYEIIEHQHARHASEKSTRKKLCYLYTFRRWVIRPKEKFFLLCTLARYKTPFYLYDLSILSQNYTRFYETANTSIRKFLICYAVKSNDHSNFLQKINELGGGADVVSIGELVKCLGSGIGPSNIVF